MKKIGVIGAGAMGKGLAKNLSLNGNDVTAYKRKIDPEDEVIKYLKENNVKITDDLNKIFSESEVLVTCVSDSPTMEKLFIQKGGFVDIKESKVEVVIDFTTALPESTQKIAKVLLEKGVEMLDSPMTGGPNQADQGKVRLAIGGKKEIFEKYKNLLENVSAFMIYAGEIGSAHTIKLFNNFLAALSLTASSGVVALAEKLDVDLEAMHAYINGGGGRSWGFDTLMNKIFSGNYKDNYFALKLAFKDVGYNKEVFKELGSFAILETLFNTMQEAMDEGYGDEDLSSMYFSLKEKMR
ncbi:MAG: NAD(P)-dependent oxidoreductase [Sphaerochaetaceae bacterium]|jgi:2-hydroxy-3-oxopropionate reductase